MISNVYLVLVASVGAWMFVINIRLLRSTYKLKRYMNHAEYGRLQGRHLGLMLLGGVLFGGSLYAYLQLSPVLG